MSMNWRQSANRPAAVARVADINRYVVQHSGGIEAPIDTFYGAVAGILRAANPTFLTTNPSMGALMLVGWVSATENYLRDILAGVIRLCPCAQVEAAQQTISLGTVIWHGGLPPERGAFEHLSFASADNIRQTCRKFADYEVKKNSPIDALLKEFDGICELRHSIVHAGSVMAGRNAVRLQIGGRPKALRVSIGFAELQEAGDICTTLVVGFNGALFELLAKRWATDWRSRPSWDSAKADRRFLSIWHLFHSKVDTQQGTVPRAMGPVRCRNLVKREFGLS
jgi:hypothetical protein